MTMMRNKLFLIFIAISLCSVHYHNVKRAVLEGQHLEYKVNYFLMQDMAESNKVSATQCWTGRGVSCWIATQICRACGLTREGFDRAEHVFIHNKTKENYEPYYQQVNKLATCAGGIASFLLFSAFLLVVWFKGV